MLFERGAFYECHRRMTDMSRRNGFELRIDLSGFDLGQIEDVIDQLKQMTPAGFSACLRSVIFAGGILRTLRPCHILCSSIL